MLSLSVIWHILWFTRIILSFVLCLVIFRRQLNKQFPLFTAYVVWLSVAGTALVAMNYARSVSGYQYFVGVAISDAGEAVLSFIIIYQMLVHTLRRYPPLSDLGNSAFRVATLIFLAGAVALAWLVPGRAPNVWLARFSIVQRTEHLLQCGQLIFLFLFCGYFRLSWRSRAFGIALGLGIVISASMAVHALRSQITSVQWDATEYALAITNDGAGLIAVLVWLSYMLAAEPRPPMTRGLPEHDLDTWNRELGRLLEP